MGKKALFDEDQDAQQEAGQLNVNQEFAKRFEHNKKREELHRLKEKYPEVAARMEARAAGGIDSEDESTSEEEDDGIIPDKTEAQIFETLMKIKRKDKSIYDKDAKFYSSEEESDGEGGKRAKKKRKEKPMYLKDVVYKEAMDLAAGLGSDSDDENEGGRRRGDEGPVVKTYTQEQQDLKNQFLHAFDEEAEAEGDEEFGGVLKARKKANNVGEGDVEDGGEGDEGKVQELLDAYFNAGGKELPEEDKFLRSYILNKGWVEHGDGDEAFDEDHGADEGDDGIDYEEDEAAWAAAQVFEANYNFRFEEPGGGQLVTHPRQLEGTIRKEDDRRKRQRAEKAARKAAEEESRRAEVKRLKNLKKAEIEDRLHEVQTVAGAAAPKTELLDELLAGDFDPEAHDRAMAAAFGDEYYDEGDEEDQDIEHDETFARELAAMADYGTDDEEAKEGTFAALERRLKEAEAAGKDEDEEGEGAAAARSDLKRLLEEYHKLDYEDHVGGIPTRFRYKEVEPETYGLTVEEILMMDDKELNQVVGLKRVAAPYREGERRLRPNYGALNEWRREQEHERNAHQKRWKERNDSKVGHKKDNRDAGKGEGDGAAAEKPEWKKKEPAPKLTEAEARLASFAVPSLKKRQREDGGVGYKVTQDGGANKKKKKSKGDGGAQQQAQQPAVPGLTKAQRKNMKRAEKRAAKQKTG